MLHKVHNFKKQFAIGTTFLLSNNVLKTIKARFLQIKINKYLKKKKFVVNEKYLKYFEIYKLEYFLRVLY